MDFVAAQARLLSDRALREEFARDPVATVRRMGVREPDREAAARIDPVGLDRQAETLLRKRLHEVAPRLPANFAALGPRAEATFFAYAETFWPEGPRRHAIDAGRFAERLLAGGLRGALAEEALRASFAAGEARFRLAFFRTRFGIGATAMFRPRAGGGAIRYWTVRAG